MKMNARALLIAACVGFVVELFLSFISAMVNRMQPSGFFGPSQQDVTLACFAGLVLIVLGLLTSASVGGLYSWLSRGTSLLPRNITLGGAAASGLAALGAS